MLASLSRKNSEHFLFFALLLAALVLSLFIAGNYGETADDNYLQIYAERTVDVYSTILGKGVFIDPSFDNLSYYGPAFLTFTQMGQNLLGLMAPAIPWLTSWHFFIFVSFLIGVAALYSIALRMFPQPVAVSICLLYATQPVLWGQGWVNAKDVPLLSFFLLSVALGIRVERFFLKSSWEFKKWRTSLNKKRKKATTHNRMQLKKVAVAWVVFVTATLFSSFFWEGLVGTLLNWVAESNPSSWIGNLFAQIAPNANALPLSGYVSKTIVYLSNFLAFIAVGWLLYILYLALKALDVKANEVGASIKASIWKNSGRYWTSPILWAAAVAVGFATAVRIIGPFAAVLVIVFLIWQKGPKAFGLVVPYLVIAGIVTFLLWPFLWISPIQHFVDSVTLMSDFPWSGRVLFEGDLIVARKLPGHYLPVLLGIQLTLSALALILIGTLIGIKQFKGPNQALIGILLLWFFLPFFYVVLNHPTLYHNFRQLLFIMPPLFLLAGFGIEWIYKQIKTTSLFWAVILIALLPGVLAIVKLHPYEYVYYNELVGGLPGAEGRYELEYWRTSFTEATRELNKIAPVNSLVVAWGSVQIVERVARPDLQLELVNARNYDQERPYDYVVVPITASRGRYFFAGFPEAVVVERQGVALVVINRLNCGCATFDPNNTQTP
ncbi:MAG: hypothetical protein WEC37_05075 [Anaerolineales bacterium]